MPCGEEKFSAKQKGSKKRHSRKFNFNLPRKPGTTRSVQESFGTFPFFLDVTIFAFMLQCSCIQTFRFFNLAHLPRNDNFFLTKKKEERKTKMKIKLYNCIRFVVINYCYCHFACLNLTKLLDFWGTYLKYGSVLSLECTTLFRCQFTGFIAFGPIAIDWLPEIDFDITLIRIIQRLNLKYKQGNKNH